MDNFVINVADVLQVPRKIEFQFLWLLIFCNNVWLISTLNLIINTNLGPWKLCFLFGRRCWATTNSRVLLVCLLIKLVTRQLGKTIVTVHSRVRRISLQGLPGVMNENQDPSTYQAWRCDSHNHYAMTTIYSCFFCFGKQTYRIKRLASDLLYWFCYTSSIGLCNQNMQYSVIKKKNISVITN